MKNALLTFALLCLLGFICLVTATVPAFAGGVPDGLEVMRGMYFYMADAALFTECETGKSFPVAMEGANRVLEEAYLKARQNPGEALLVTLEGRIVERMPMEGPGPVPTLLPDKFLDISTSESCEKQPR